MRVYINSEKKRARSRKKHENLQKLANTLATVATKPDMRALVLEHYEQAGGMLRSLRSALVAERTSAFQRPLRASSDNPAAWADAE